MPPPGLMAFTAPPGEHITGERDTDLSTASAQERYLVREMGCTYPQAKAMIRAYRADLERPLVTAGRTHSLSFLAWLMSQAPGPGRQRGVLKHEWRVSSA